MEGVGRGRQDFSGPPTGDPADPRSLPGTRQSGPVNPREDEQLAHETEGLVRSGHPTRVEEFRDPEPAGEDQPTGDEHLMGPGREPGTAPGLTPDDVETRSEIARFLDRAALPGSR